ncbi:MAG: ATP-dependent helicase C-terminal domain-containing protein [Actinomycetaceae bacterium]|nr:ATP-dependent helicase C-terminal domain-containing protein [Actinomycetaceae bacterium]
MDAIARVLADSNLPVLDAESQVRAALDRRERFVLAATPGSGKTTLVPLIMRQWLAEQNDDRRVLIAQPRRVAVRSAARFVASLLDENPGETVGWTMRGDRVMSARTRIEFTTTGTLLRRLLADPDLPEVAALVIDEVHERQIDADLALAFALDIADLREDLHLGVMSATAQTDTFRALLEGSLIEIESTAYPLAVEWVPARDASVGPRGATDTFLSHMVTTAMRAFAEYGSTLVFVPSIRDVTAITTALSSKGVPVYALHGSLTSAEQDAALADNGPRIVVATDIAETSLTVPGVNCVVDSGLARIPRFDAARDAQELVTVMASQSSVTQRGGRANRTGPGIVYRCFSETDFARMRRYPVPEIEAADLTEAGLLAAAWSSPAELRMPTPFPPPRLSHAVSVLDSIAALNGWRERQGEREPTPGGHRTGERSMGEPSPNQRNGGEKSMGEPSGRPRDVVANAMREPSEFMGEPSRWGSVTASDSGSILARIPADPRLSHALLLASAWSDSTLASRIVAHLAASEKTTQPDITRSLQTVPQRDVKRFAHLAAQHERAYAAQFERPAETISRDDLPGVTVGLAYPGRIARRRNSEPSARNTVSFISAGGAGYEVDQRSPLAGDEWIAVSQIQTINGVTYVRQAAPLNPAWVPFIARALMRESSEVRISGGRLRGSTTRSVGAIDLMSEPSDVEADDALAAVAEAVRRRGLALFKPSKNAQQLARTIEYIGQQREDWPRLTHDFLADNVATLLGADMQRMCMGEPLASVDLTTGLKTLIGWEKAARIRDEIPESIELPTGRRARLTLDPDRGPTVRVKLQECFGWSAIPTVLGRPITFELLSPAGRPLAITSDLEHFFNNVYKDVRADMRGRYPKHPWPEDPWSAQPTARTKRRQ